MEALKWAWRNQQIRMLGHPSSTGLSLQRLFNVVSHQPLLVLMPIIFSKGVSRLSPPSPRARAPFVLPLCHVPTPDDLLNKVW